MSNNQLWGHPLYVPQGQVVNTAQPSQMLTTSTPQLIDSNINPVMNNFNDTQMMNIMSTPMNYQGTNLSMRNQFPLVNAQLYPGMMSNPVYQLPGNNTLLNQQNIPRMQGDHIPNPMSKPTAPRAIGESCSGREWLEQLVTLQFFC